MNRRHIFKEFQRLLHCHIQNVVDTLTLILDLQGLTVVSFPSTHLTWHIDIREKMHLDLQNSVTVAGFTSAAFHIKAESAFLVSPGLRICCSCEQVSDHVKDTGVGCRVRPRCTTDRRLINVNNLIQLLHTHYFII